MKNLLFLVILILAIALDAILIPTYYATLNQDFILKNEPIAVKIDNSVENIELPTISKQRRFIHTCDKCGKHYFCLTKNCLLRKLCGCCHSE